MKFDELRSIAHNLADSLASGCSFLMGVYELDVFGAARASAHGSMTVDFLSGTCAGVPASPQLTEAMKLSRNALSTLCQKHGTTQAAFRELTVRYWIDGVQPAFQSRLKTIQDIARPTSIGESQAAGPRCSIPWDASGLCPASATRRPARCNATAPGFFYRSGSIFYLAPPLPHRMISRGGQIDRHGAQRRP